MAQNQHYVPQFYLKKFSGDSRSINTFNLKEQRFFRASIRSQCSKSNFYGNSVALESTSSKLESMASSTFNKIINTEELHLEFPDFVTLFSYILWQSGRTKKAGESVFEHINAEFGFQKTNSVNGKDARELGVTQDDMVMLNIIHDYPAILTSLIAMNSSLCIADLRLSLFINKSKREFITSDAPVVLINTFFNRKIKGGQIGYANRGLQIFYPISPKHMLVMYDPKYYSIPIEKDLKVIIQKDEDVITLNGLQLILCLENVYYSAYENTDLEQQYKKLQKLRNIKSSKIYTIKDFPKYNLKTLKLIKIKKNVNPHPGNRNEIALKESKDSIRNLFYALQRSP